MPRDYEIAKDDLSVTIVYFHREETDIDIDNIIKPILDALAGLVYVDDKLVAQVLARRTRLSDGLIIRDMDESLALGIDEGSDFTYVIVDEEPDHTVIP